MAGLKFHMFIAAWIAAVIALLAAGPLLLRFRRRWVAAFNLVVTNRITSRFANRLPAFGIVTHVGRKSGRVYRTPVNVFRVPDGFVIALTYGHESQWVRNILAAGGCELETQSVKYRLSGPVVVRDPGRSQFPVAVRAVLRIVGADEFLRVSIAPVPASLQK